MKKPKNFKRRKEKGNLLKDVIKKKQNINVNVKMV